MPRASLNKLGRMEEELKFLDIKIKHLTHQANKLRKEIEETKKRFYTSKDVLGPWVYCPNGFFDNATDPCLVYQDSLYIELHDDEYYLVIENQDWTSQCLAELEGILADYAIDCGYTPWIDIQP